MKHIFPEYTVLCGQFFLSTLKKVNLLTFILYWPFMRNSQKYHYFPAMYLISLLLLMLFLCFWFFSLQLNFSVLLICFFWSIPLWLVLFLETSMLLLPSSYKSWRYLKYFIPYPILVLIYFLIHSCWMFYNTLGVSEFSI